MGVIFATRMQKNILKKCPNRPYLKGPSARETGFLFFVVLQENFSQEAVKLSWDFQGEY